MPSMRVRVATGVLVGMSLLLAACGGSKGGANAPVATTTAAGAVDPNGTEPVAAGDITDNQVFVTYSSRGGAFALKYPQGWAQVRSGASTSFSQHFNEIVVSRSSAASAPTTTSVRSTELPMLQSLPGFKLGAITTISRPAGAAVRITYAATSAPDPLTGKTVALDVERYVFWRAGHTVTITLSSPKGSDNVDPWKTVTDSFTWT